MELSHKSYVHMEAPCHKIKLGNRYWVNEVKLH